MEHKLQPDVTFSNSRTYTQTCKYCTIYKKNWYFSGEHGKRKREDDDHSDGNRGDRGGRGGRGRGRGGRGRGGNFNSDTKPEDDKDKGQPSSAGAAVATAQPKIARCFVAHIKSVTALIAAIILK